MSPWLTAGPTGTMEDLETLLKQYPEVERVCNRDVVRKHYPRVEDSFRIPDNFTWQQLQQAVRAVPEKHLQGIGETFMTLFSSDPAHAELIDNLSANSILLAGGYASPTLPSVTASILGTKGSGKTFCLQAYTHLAPLRFPGLIVAHVDLQKASKSGEMNAPDFLETVMAAALVRAGVLDKRWWWSAVPGMNYMKNELARQDKFLVLLLDEFEHAFKLEGLDQNTEEASPLLAARCRQRFVESVSCLPDTIERPPRLRTVLCGSSVHLQSLITGYMSQETRQQFRAMAEGYSGINGSKFHSLLLARPLPGAVDAVAGMIVDHVAGQEGRTGQEMPQEVHRRALVLASMVTFVYGSAAREVVRFYGDGSPPTKLQGSDDNLDSVILHDVLLALQQENKEVLDSMRGEICREVHQISCCSCSHRRSFLSLGSADHVSAWHKLSVGQKKELLAQVRPNMGGSRLISRTGTVTLLTSSLYDFRQSCIAQRRSRGKVSLCCRDKVKRRLTHPGTQVLNSHGSLFSSFPPCLSSFTSALLD